MFTPIETRPLNAGRRRIRFPREHKAVDMKSSAQGSNPAGAERWFLFRLLFYSILICPITTCPIGNLTGAMRVICREGLRSG